MVRTLGQRFHSLLATGLCAAALVVGCGNSASNAADAHTILDDVINSKVLKVGTYADDAPWSSYDSSNQLVGFDIDVVNMLAADLGAKVEWSVLPNSAARISALQAGTVQLVAANFTLTAQRALSISFSTPYAAEQEILAVSNKYPNVKTYHDLTNANKCAIVTGSTQEALAQLAPQAQFIHFQDLAAETAALQSGQADCVMENKDFIDNLVANNPNLVEGGVAQVGLLALGSPRDDLVWLNWLNQAIEYHGAHQDIQILYAKWFKGAVMPHVLPNF
jgi:polar amino acid transport system substrate-binding protein